MDASCWYSGGYHGTVPPFGVLRRRRCPEHETIIWRLTGLPGTKEVFFMQLWCDPISDFCFRALWKTMPRWSWDKFGEYPKGAVSRSDRISTDGMTTGYKVEKPNRRSTWHSWLLCVCVFLCFANIIARDQWPLKEATDFNVFKDNKA